MNTVSTLSEYPPLEQARRTVKPKWYRCPIDKDRLRELTQRSDRQGWIQAGGHFCIYIVFVTLSVYFWNTNNLWAMIGCLWLVGLVASFFKGTAPHELGHGTVFKTRKLNRFFLYLFSLISWWDPFDYATSHTYHHRYTTHPEADRENVLPIQPSLHPWVLLRLFTIDLFTRPGRNFGKGGFFWAVYLTTRRAIGLSSGHQHIPSQEWLQSLHKDQPDSYRQSVLWSRFLILFHVCVLMYCIATGHWIWLAVITTASFTANGAAYFVGIPQHCGLRQNVNDFRKNTRSMKLNAVLEFLYWRMNWHTEHHMYSGVPCYNLKALAAEIADDMPPPRTLLGAWKEMRKIWHRQKIDPTYEFDTPVPTVAANSSEDNANSLVVSLGDLAPKSLR